MGKLSLFTREGKFIKEMKASHNFFGSRFLALGQQYVGLGSKMEGNINYFPYCIKDGKLYQLIENEEEEVWELYVLDSCFP